MREALYNAAGLCSYQLQVSGVGQSFNGLVSHSIIAVIVHQNR